MYIQHLIRSPHSLIAFCCLILCFATDRSSAQGDFSLRGSISSRLTLLSARDETLLNPQQQLVTLPEWVNRLYSDLTISAFSPKWDILLTLRPIFDQTEDDTENEIFVDNAYVIYRSMSGFFLTAGKQNFAEGVALHFNPTDFLGEGKEVDPLLTEEERKQQREGSYFIRLERLYPSWTLSLLVAPELGRRPPQKNRGILKISKQFGSADGSLLVLVTDDRPGLGLNFSTTYGVALELHVEAALRRESHRGFLEKGVEVFPDSGIFQYEIVDPEDENELFAQMVVGGHYTFSNKVNVIFEYFYNQDGYNEAEWQSFTDAIEQNNSLLLSFPNDLRSLLLRNLSLANSLMTFRSLRQHYAFLRISKPQLIHKIEATLVYFTNLEDKSFVLNPRLEYKWIKGFSFSVGALVFEGKQTTEFAFTPMQNQWYFQVQKSF